MEPGRGTFDRDLDLQPVRPAPARNEPLEPYQRLIANPFLTVLGWLIAFAAIRSAVKNQILPLLHLGMWLAVVGVFLLQFHCLDCGATGWLLRRRRHACPPVLARWQIHEARRFRGPGIAIQLGAWFVLMVTAFVLVMVLVVSGR